MNPARLARLRDARIAIAIVAGTLLASLGPLSADVGTQSGNHPEPTGASWARTDERAAAVGYFDDRLPSPWTSYGPIYAESTYSLHVWTRVTTLADEGTPPQTHREGRILLRRYDHATQLERIWSGAVGNTNTFAASPSAVAVLHATLTDESGAACSVHAKWNASLGVRVHYLSANAIEHVSDRSQHTMTGSCVEGAPEASGSYGRVWHRTDRRSSDDPARDDHLGDGGIITVAGVRQQGSAGDGGPARWAHLGRPRDLAVESDGSILLAEPMAIRRIDPSGVIETVIEPRCSYTEDGPDPSNGLCGARAVGARPDGSIIVADVSDRVLRFSSTGAFLGALTRPRSVEDPWSYDQNAPEGIAVDAAGRIFVAEQAGHRVRRIDPNGSVTVVAGTGVCDESITEGTPPLQTSLCSPSDVAVAPDGTLYVTEPHSGRIRTITAGSVTTVIQGPADPIGVSWYDSYWSGIAIGPDGRLYGANAAGKVYRFDGDLATHVAGGGMLPIDGGPATLALLDYPEGLAFDGDGHLLIAESGGNAIRLADVL